MELQCWTNNTCINSTSSNLMKYIILHRVGQVNSYQAKLIGQFLLVVQILTSSNIIITFLINVQVINSLGLIRAKNEASIKYRERHNWEIFNFEKVSLLQITIYLFGVWIEVKKITNPPINNIQKFMKSIVWNILKKVLLKGRYQWTFIHPFVKNFLTLQNYEWLNYYNLLVFYLFISMSNIDWRSN